MLNCSGYLPFARIAIFCYCKSARIELSSTCVTLWLINNIISYFNVTTKSRWVLNPVSTRTLSIFRPWFFMTIGSHPFNLSISTVFISDKINNWATCDFRGSFFIKEKCFTCCVYQTTILTLFESSNLFNTVFISDKFICHFFVERSQIFGFCICFLLFSALRCSTFDFWLINWFDFAWNIPNSYTYFASKAILDKARTLKK